MRTVVWISGASSGIGAALADSVPYDRAPVIGISRRPPARGEHVEADLSRPTAWPGIAAQQAESHWNELQSSSAHPTHPAAHRGEEGRARCRER